MRTTARMTRRRFLALAGRAGAGGALLSVVPSILYREPWVSQAAAQTPPTVEATFVALVETVNGTEAGDPQAAAAARWIIAEFDTALPPLPEGSPSAAVAALLDAYTVRGGSGPTFATAPTEGRIRALELMVKDPTPDVRQVANQILPFAGFAYWSDVALGAPAEVGGPRLPQWDVAGFPGPSHSYLDRYLEGHPPGFRPTDDFEP